MSDHDRIDRRRFVQAIGAATASIALPGTLAACGDEDEPGPIERAVARRSIGVDYASYYAPIQDIHRLVLARARERGAAVTFSHDESGAAAQRRTLERWIGPSGGFRAVVIAPFDAAVVEPLAAKARAQDIAIVSYLVPLRDQTAAISVDPARAGELLADDVAAWARGREVQVLLVRPPRPLLSPDPFASEAAAIERALRQRLAGKAPNLQAVAATEAQGKDDAEAAVRRALADYPQVTAALTWNDSTALGAAAALLAGGTTPQHLYAGGVALPGIAGKANLRAVADADMRVTVVAPRLRDLAQRLVDVPLALLRHRGPASGTVTPTAVSASSPALGAYAADYVR